MLFFLKFGRLLTRAFFLISREKQTREFFIKTCEIFFLLIEIFDKLIALKLKPTAFTIISREYTFDTFSEHVLY